MTTNNKDNTLSIGRSNYAEILRHIVAVVEQYLNTAFEHYVLQRHSQLLLSGKTFAKKIN